MQEPFDSYYKEFSYGVDIVDPVRTKKIKARHFISAVNLIFRFPEDIKNICLPTLILEGSQDSLLDPQGSFELAQKIGSNNKKVIIYKGADHSLYNDVFAKEIYQDTLDWIKRWD